MAQAPCPRTMACNAFGSTVVVIKCGHCRPDPPAQFHQPHRPLVAAPGQRTRRAARSLRESSHA